MSNDNDTSANTANSAPARDPFGPVTDAEWSRHASFGRRGVNLMLADRRRAWLAAMPADAEAERDALRVRVERAEVAMDALAKVVRDGLSAYVGGPTLVRRWRDAALKALGEDGTAQAPAGPEVAP